MLVYIRETNKKICRIDKNPNKEIQFYFLRNDSYPALGQRLENDK